MLYLLDANVLIDANRDYYPIDRVHPFWEWLVDCGSKGVIKIPIEQFEEIKAGNITDDHNHHHIDLLAKWAKESRVKEALLFDEQIEQLLVAKVIDEGYADNLTDDEIEKLGRDPFLIAYALKDPINRGIVTTEHSRPTRTRANRHLPDVCDHFGIKHYDTYEIIRILDFKVNKTY